MPVRCKPCCSYTTFWQLSLSYLARGLHGAWPQYDVGLVLWCLSVAADDWQTQTRLTRLCTIPVIGVLEATWDNRGDDDGGAHSCGRSCGSD